MMREMNQKRIVHSAAVAVLCGMMQNIALADDVTWVGAVPGSVFVGVNWSTNAPPGPGDIAKFNGNGGSVSLGASLWQVGQIEIDNNSNDWTFHDGTLQTSQIHNRGSDGFGNSTNRIASDVTILGAQIYSQDLFFVAASDQQLNIDGIIIDGETPVEAHLRAKLSNDNTYTGRTQAWSGWQGLELLGSMGRISQSQQLDVFAAEMVLNNQADFDNNATNDDWNEDRLSDTANVTLRDGRLTLLGRYEGDLTESIGSMTVARGRNTVQLFSGSGDLIALHLTDASAALTRTDRGVMGIDTGGNADLGNHIRITLESAPAGELATGVIPYLGGTGNVGLVAYVSAPVVYDPGDDSAIGGGDDVGLRTLLASDFTDLTSATSMTHALLADTSTTLNLSTIAQTFTFAGNGTGGAGTLTLNTSLTVNEGVLFLNNGSTINGMGTLDLGSGEGIVHVNGGNATIDAPVSIHNLTKAGDNSLRLTNPNNSITGETVVNSSSLILGAPTAGGTAPIRMVDASLTLDFAGGTFGNTLTWNSGADGPTGGFRWINDLRLQDGETVYYTGRIEGDGALALRGDGSKLVLLNTGVNTDPRTPFFLIGTDATIEINGVFGTPNGGGYIWADPDSLVIGNGEVIGAIVMQNNSVLKPGSTASPVGILTTTRFELNGGSTLEIQNGSTGTRGIHYDAMDVGTDGARLDGTIRMVSTVQFPAGSTFDILNIAGFYEGNPTLVADTPLTGGRQYVKIFHPNKLTIGVAGYTGDANLDGKVNTLDFNLLAGSFGMTSGANWLMGDFDYDRAVNSIDFNALAGNYGKLATPPSAMLGSVVPEPAGLGALALLGTIGVRRRSRD